ncbi:MAG TPA: MobC family plasmid mobilization relaxosome protein [Agitococcus sp.]|nr:MobC family plasmid mobilization relaxosome protein [Agitococcus sp.]
MKKTLTKEQRKQYREQDKANGIKIVSVRLTAEEYGFLAKRAEAAGESPTSYLKNAALHNMAEKRHLDQFELEILRTALIEVRRIGNNLNQIAHHLNTGFSINMDEVKYQMRYLEDTIRKYFGR